MPKKKKYSCIADECVRFLFGQFFKESDNHKQITLGSFVAFEDFSYKTDWAPSYLSKDAENLLELYSHVLKMYQFLFDL